MNYQIPVVVGTSMSRADAEDMAAGLNLAFEKADAKSALAVLTVVAIRLAKDMGVKPEQWEAIVRAESLRIYGVSPTEPPTLAAHGRALRPRVRRVPR